MVLVPVHACSDVVELLQSVHAHVAVAVAGIFGYDGSHSNERTAVFGPTFEDGKLVQHGRVGIGNYYFLTGSMAACDLGWKLCHFHEHGQKGELFHKALRYFRFDKGADSIGNCIQIIHFQGEAHAPVGAEGVDQDGHVVALNIGEEQGLVALFQLADTVSDFSQFQVC